MMQRLVKRQLRQQLTTLFKRECGDVAAVDPHDVKHVICDFAAGPGDLAVENQFVMRKSLDRLLDCGNVLRQMVARKQLNVVALLVSQQADAVELSFEDPL